MPEQANLYNSARRIWILAIVSILLFGGLLTRLVHLQVIQYGYFTAVAESQRQRAGELRPNRGTIYMSDSTAARGDELFPVASNQSAFTAYAMPRVIDDPARVVDSLAPALLAFRQRQEEQRRSIIENTGQAGRAEELAEEPVEEPAEQDQLDLLRQELLGKLNRKTDPYEPLIRPYELIDDELKRFITDKNLPGIVLEEQEVRTYPEKTLAAHVLGYLGYEEAGRVGRSGIEGYFETELAGQQGFLVAERDAAGGFIGVGNQRYDKPEDGVDIVLTLDRVVQTFIEEELKKGIETFSAEGGSIIVMNPKTGAIVGMATYPTFDPNYYYAIADARVQSNPVVSNLFEPGSILKPAIMAAAIEDDLVEPDTTMVDNGPVRVAEYTIDTFDGKHSGVTTMTEVLEQSNNVGMVWVGQQLGAETMYDYLRRFGLGERTGITLDGETQSSLPEPDTWNITTVATASFGQGIALTPLQALNAINALANGGQLPAPHIVRELRYSDGRIVTTDMRPIRQVVSSATAAELTAMMVSVIENGVAGLARVPGYYLAGKTGTAQVPDERGRYSPDRKIISFVGYGPVENPQFSVLIKLDNPAGLSFASGTAAPMFRNIAAKLLQYYQIPPSYDPAQKTKFKVSSPGGY
jgi:cell division protein FtsI/penicillin-binding protein 2